MGLETGLELELEMEMEKEMDPVLQTVLRQRPTGKTTQHTTLMHVIHSVAMSARKAQSTPQGLHLKKTVKSVRVAFMATRVAVLLPVWLEDVRITKHPSITGLGGRGGV